jgi:hypothetical protein
MFARTIYRGLPTPLLFTLSALGQYLAVRAFV